MALHGVKSVINLYSDGSAWSEECVINLYSDASALREECFMYCDLYSDDSA